MRQGKYPFVIGFLLAPVLLYSVFVLWPIFGAAQVSTMNWSGLSPKRDFVGLDNFSKLLADDKVWLAAKHHIFLLVTLPVITIALALFFAFLLNMGGGTRGGVMTGVWGSKFYRVVFFLPQVLAVVIVGVIFGRVYAPDGSGILNRFLHLFGVTDVYWMADYGMWAILGVLVWQAVGFYVVLFAAGMSSIPGEIYEAAVMDGASRVTIFFRVTIPMLKETVKVAWVYLGILAMDAFALVMVLTIDQGGPDGATSVLPVQIYQAGILKSQYGYASALGVALAVFTIIFAVLSLRGGKRDAIEH
ncbi:carbohydrate ABC transporter permease [Catellatospora tritici]|uniref:carbohydrate ABC transporter permease n=1 Tax=Catellatospora tritici TaxID=2851566 RepID=UPI001C2D58B0|nr:sugar ABC transporter permease [Catellatospora tritici]MBV1852254.1 sugar ABC transporter permease [Catellatospora tritici]